MSGKQHPKGQGGHYNNSLLHHLKLMSSWNSTRIKLKQESCYIILHQSFTRLLSLKHLVSYNLEMNSWHQRLAERTDLGEFISCIYK